MQFLIVLRRRSEAFSDEQFAALADAEAAAARGLYAEGFTRQIWSRADEPGAVMLVEAADAEEAERRLQALPFYKAGMLERTTLTALIPYRGIKA
jgi:muconolactone delta-isomerase